MVCEYVVENINLVSLANISKKSILTGGEKQMIAENLKKLYNKIVISIALIILIVISSLSTIAYSHELYYINGQKYPVRWYWKITEAFL
ncbi:hypothetical protein CaldiYA01_15790 [Caldicellulosiruptor diazotrophicus]|uniref:Uncharacterized protein n=2 Tax=Caldicellulosiruptor diazotrophicus TaxID=2806205 RepID=A0ABM7NN99_9FIRM|nr:hypothetical protein CaldiYA01_15790 [Caldicellulosiruptor diazotrophicus]